MSQWSTYGKPDPLVPFELGVLTELQAVLQAGADDSREVIGRLKHLTDSRDSLVWDGDAAEAFFADIADLPLNLTKLVSSYNEASSAVGAYIVDLTRIRRMADMRLDVISSYESKIASLELDLAGVPPEDQEYRTELEREISTNRTHRDDMVRDADVVLHELEGAADQFARAMRNAQDLGIHNRLGFVRFYQDHLDIYVDSLTGGMDILRSWLTVVGLACMVVPIPGARIVGGVLIASGRAMGALSVTLKFADNLLSDDDADFSYWLDAGMTTLGLGTYHGRMINGLAMRLVSPNSILNGWRHGLSMAKYSSLYPAVSQVDEVVTVADNTVSTIDFTMATLDIRARNLEATPVPSSGSAEMGEPGSTGTDLLRSGISIGFEDPIWTVDRLMVSPYVTTPTLVDLEVDVLSSANED